MKILDVPSSGSMAGTTTSHNRAGQYRRNRRTPVNPVGTGRRAVVRANFSASSSAWAALTFSQQAAWGAYADSHPIVDRLGQSIKLTGHQMFVSINSQLQNVIQPISSVPPVSSDVFAASPAQVFVTPAGLFYVQASALGDPADFLLVAMSGAKSGGVTFNKTFWQAQVYPGDQADPIDVGGKMVAQFGLPPDGSRVFFQLTPVNQYGVKGTPVIGFAQVASPGNAPVATAGAATIINWTHPGAFTGPWTVEQSLDGGITWAWAATVALGTYTYTGLTSGALGRVFGLNSDGSLASEVSNSVVIV